MSRIDELAAEIHAEISEKRRAEREAKRKDAISTQKMREYIRARKQREAEEARQARNQRLIDEALEQAAQMAAEASESEADAEPEQDVEDAVEDVLEAPRAKLNGLIRRYPEYGTKGVELHEAADILGVTEQEVRGLLDSGELEPFVVVSEWRSYDENGVVSPPERKVYEHLVTIESLKAHVNA